MKTDVDADVDADAAAELCKMVHAEKCIFPFLPTFFDHIKNVKTEKFWSPQMIKVCQKLFLLPFF